MICGEIHLQPGYGLISNRLKLTEQLYIDMMAKNKHPIIIIIIIIIVILHQTTSTYINLHQLHQTTSTYINLHQHTMGTMSMSNLGCFFITIVYTYNHHTLQAGIKYISYRKGTGKSSSQTSAGDWRGPMGQVPGS